jgi:hypothetical protein
MSAIRVNTIENNKAIKITPGLKSLESCIEPDTFIYILRSLYHLIFTSKKFRENKQQLQRRICEFEEQSGLPGFLSAAPIDALLKELEDAQFFYPVRRREVTFPTFH